MAGELLLINPRKRRKAKAATKRPTKRATRRRAKNKKQHVAGYYPNPSPVRRRRRRLSALKTRVKRIGRKYKRNPSVRLSIGSITGMAKNAAIGAAGALAVDVAFGYAKGVLPASMQSPVAADGSINPLYYAAKGALAVAVGVFGSKLTKHAADMAAGSMTVSAYEVMRSFVPMSINLGYVSPARIAGSRRGVPNLTNMTKQAMNQYVSGYSPPSSKPFMGQYVS